MIHDKILGLIKPISLIINKKCILCLINCFFDGFLPFSIVLRGDSGFLRTNTPILVDYFYEILYLF